MRWHSNESFALTIPNEADQKRLRKQKRWRRLGNYVPNSLSPGTRLLYGGVVIAWATWSAIGLLFGHMFLLVSRRGPIHFSGVAALLFSAAVLTMALVLAAYVVDHYDTRDNEEVYQQVRAWLWRVAISLLVLAWMVGCTTSMLQSDARTFVGLVETENVAGFLKSSWIAERLAPIHGSFPKWFFLSLCWLALWAVVARLASPRQLSPSSRVACTFGRNRAALDSDYAVCALGRGRRGRLRLSRRECRHGSIEGRVCIHCVGRVGTVVVAPRCRSSHPCRSSLPRRD